MTQAVLLSIIEVGGYPDFTSLYESFGYQVQQVTNMRQALKRLKQAMPAVIVAEFNFQSDFRDRTSSLESMMALVQRHEKTQVIVLYDQEFAHQLERLAQRFQFAATLTFPICEVSMRTTLEQIPLS